MAEKKTVEAAPIVRALVKRDYWPTDKDEDRVRAGTIVEVSVDALIDGMEKGILARAPAEA